MHNKYIMPFFRWTASKLRDEFHALIGIKDPSIAHSFQPQVLTNITQHTINCFHFQKIMVTLI